MPATKGIPRRRKGTGFQWLRAMSFTGGTYTDFCMIKSRCRNSVKKRVRNLMFLPTKVHASFLIKRAEVGIFQVFDKANGLSGTFHLRT